jgi:MYXO-CTERM domain-containing protein
MYELFVGEVTPIYCTGFEGDPSAEGWSHQLLAGQASGADDWTFGAPQGTAGSGDPSDRLRGRRCVAGNDLGGGNFNGLYQPGKTNVLVSPTIELTGFQNVRLQYRRWLNVEDGFYDQARIRSNDQQVWSNYASTDEQGRRPHRTGVALPRRRSVVDDPGRPRRGEVRAAVGPGPRVLGGWTIDDFCIVGFGASVRRRQRVRRSSSATTATSPTATAARTTARRRPPRSGVRQRPASRTVSSATTATSSTATAVRPRAPRRPRRSAPSAATASSRPARQCDDGIFDGSRCAPGCVLPTVDPGLAQLDEESGCGCSTGRRSPGAPWALALLVFGLAFRRRR